MKKKFILRNLATLTLMLLGYSSFAQVSLAADILTGTGGGYPTHLAEYNGKLYFNAYQDATGYELYVYDGNTVSLAADIVAGTSSSNPQYLTVYNGKLYFNVYQNATGNELYVYDGNTVSLAADILAGGGGSSPQYLTVYNGKLYFRAFLNATGSELYVYDGNTVSLAADILAGIDSSSPTYLTVYNGKLYFNAYGATGSELYVYDGNTVSLTADILAGAGSSNPTYLAEYNGNLYFKAYLAATGNELYVYDGNTVSLAADIVAGSSSSNPEYLTVYNGKLYFNAYQDATGNELYVYDGNTVSLAADILAGGGGANPSHLAEFDGKLFFNAYMDATGIELYSFNPVGPTTQLKLGSCGATLSSMTQLIYADYVYQAEMYEYQFTNTVTSQVYTAQRFYAKVTLQHLGINELGATFDVQVKVKYNGTWGAFGAVCQVTTPSNVPNTKLRSGSCGASIVSFGQNIYADYVSGATNYEFEFTNTSSSQVTTKVRSYPKVTLQQVGLGGSYDQVYDVRVRARIGGQWGNFSTVCSLTGPASSLIVINDDPTQSVEKTTIYAFAGEDHYGDNTFEINAYPNPFNSNVAVDFGGNTLRKEIKIYNALGQVVRSFTTSDIYLNIELSDLDQGVYILHVMSNGEMKSIRLVKQ